MNKIYEVYVDTSKGEVIADNSYNEIEPTFTKSELEEAIKYVQSTVGFHNDSNIFCVFLKLRLFKDMK